MKLKSIRDNRELDRVLERVDGLWGAKPGTPHGDELDMLMMLVEKYEEKHCSIPPSDPVEAISFLIEQNDLSGLRTS